MYSVSHRESPGKYVKIWHHTKVYGEHVIPEIGINLFILNRKPYILLNLSILSNILGLFFISLIPKFKRF